MSQTENRRRGPSATAAHLDAEDFPASVSSTGVDKVSWKPRPASGSTVYGPSWAFHRPGRPGVRVVVPEVPPAPGCHACSI